MWTTADAALARQLKESEPANAALVDYAYMGEGDRSLRKLVARYKDRKEAGAVVPTARLETLQDWSVKYRWSERVAVYDGEERAKRLRAAQLDLDGMHKRHIQMAGALQAKAVLWLKDEEHALYKPADVLAFLKIGVEMERLARGVPGVILELNTMTNDQLLARYAGLLDALRAAGGADAAGAGGGDDGGA